MDLRLSIRWARILLIVGALQVIGSVAGRGFVSQGLNLLEPQAFSQPVSLSGSETVQSVLDQREPSSGAMVYAPLDANKVCGLLFIGGMILLFNGVVLQTRSRWPTVFGRFHCFPLALAISIGILIVGYRLLIGAGLGGQTQPDLNGMTASGIILNDVDNLSYAAWASQAAAGRNQFEILFTTNEHRAAYVNPYFWLVGQASRLTKLPVLAVMNFIGIIAAMTTVISVYWIAVLAGLGVWAARWAAFLVAFSSGWSALITFLHAVTGLPLLLGVDVLYLESISFTTFCCWPYQACMLGLLSISILLVIGVDQAGKRGALTCALLLPLTVYLLAASHPYDGVMLFGSLALVVGGSFLFRGYGGMFSKRHLAVVFLLGCVMAPVIMYSLWMARQPVWDHFAEYCLSEWRPRWAWIIGYGWTLPLAIVGGIYGWFHCKTFGARWMVTWMAVVVVAVIVINTNRTTKMCNGGHLPMCLCAGIAAAAGLQAIGRLRRRRIRWLGFMVVAAIAMSMTWTSIGMLAYGFRTHRFDTSLVEVARLLESTPDRSSFLTVLADPATARLLCVMAPCRTYCGHYALTPDYEQKRLDLQRAGLIRLPSSGATVDVSPLDFQSLVDRAGADFAVIHQDAPARLIADDSVGLSLCKTVGTWRIYRSCVDPRSRNRDPSAMQMGSSATFNK